jgi:Nuclease-related domain
VNVGSNDFRVPDDLSELLGPASRLPGSPTLHGSPSIPVETAVLEGSPGTSTRAKLDRGRVLFGRRLSDEQRALRDQVKAELEVGEVLARLRRVGAQVLHDRLAPDGGQLDHIVVSEAGIHLIESIASTPTAPFAVSAARGPQLGVAPLEQRLAQVHRASRAVGPRVVSLYPIRLVSVYPLAAVNGVKSALAGTWYDVDVVAAALVPQWITRLPSVHSPVVVAALTDAIARVCPPAR